MTKERKLAIEMWKYIRDNHDAYVEYIDTHGDDEDFEDEDALADLKHKFLKDKDVHWAMSCWFCQYIGHRGRTFSTCRCKYCPLKSCDTGAYYILTHSPTQDQYIDACNLIIEALGGEI